MKTRRFLTTLCVLTISFTVAWAQGPNNSGTYYANADGKKGAALKTALSEIIYNKTERDYDDLWTDFRTTDKRPDGKVWDMYSGITNFVFGTDQAGNYSAEGDKYNREHSFPKSWFGIKGSNIPKGPGTDLFHLYPTDGFVNGKRSNYPFGETNSPTYSSEEGFSKLGSCSYPGYTKTVFEPNDLYKGDFARTYFYMVTCYEEQIPTWYSKYANDFEGAKATMDGNKYPGLTAWQLEMLMKWAKKDEVSAKERARNTAVYGIQNNRNPFIDYPGLEQYIWGDWQDVAFSYDQYVNPYGGENPPVTVSTPTFSPAGGTYTSAQNVTISCSTSGATIYYTTDSSTPSASSTVYSGVISVSETTTLKAIAIKDDASSNVATATYTISSGGDPTPVTGDGIFKKVLSTSELESGKRYIIVSGTHALTKLDGKAGSGSIMISSSQIDMNNSSNTALILTMEKDGNYWTVNSDDGYMALTSNSNTLNSSMTATENTAKWTVSVSSGIASVTNVNYSGRSLKYNTSNDMFRCYTNGQADIEIYKELEPTTIPGDIVKDGEVTFADLKALVKILMGIDASGDGEIDEDAADVNKDRKTNIADVTKLVNLLLKK